MKDLRHTNDQKVKAALAQAREQGDATWVKPLLEAYGTTRGRDSRGNERLAQYDENLVLEQVFVDALGDISFSHIKPDLLSFCGIVASHAMAAWRVLPRLLVR